MKYETKKLGDRIYMVRFESHYNLCMFFLRYQETYESPNDKFRNQQFEILDFMEWYSERNVPSFFSYPSDWGGFNLPSYIVDQVWERGILDRNKYDYEMMMLHRKIKEEVGKDYYLIGISNGAANDDPINVVMTHEIAHALYFTNPEYKAEMDRLNDKLDLKLKESICSWLKNIGYTESVYLDEIQAYLATGFSKGMEFNWKAASKPYTKIFNNFYNKMK